MTNFSATALAVLTYFGCLQPPQHINVYNMNKAEADSISIATAGSALIHNQENAESCKIVDHKDLFKALSGKLSTSERGGDCPSSVERVRGFSLSSADIKKSLSGKYIRPKLTKPTDAINGKMLGDGPFFIEHFAEDGTWMRTEFQASSKSMVGSWLVTNDRVCVTFLSKKKCRKVYKFYNKHVEMQSWRLGFPINYELFQGD